MLGLYVDAAPFEPEFNPEQEQMRQELDSLRRKVNEMALAQQEYS